MGDAKATSEPKPKSDAKPGAGLTGSVIDAIRLFKDNGLGAGLRAATADGQGSYMAAMFFFGIAALAFHYAILPQTSREGRLEGTLSQRQEALAGERFPVLAGLVIRPAKPLVCPVRDADETDDKAWGARVAVTDKLRGELEAIVGAFMQGLHDERAVRAAQETMRMQWFVPPLRLEPACKAVTANVGPAWTETRSGFSTLFMPSTEAAHAELDCDPCAASSMPACIARVEQRLVDEYAPALQASLALDRLPDHVPGTIHLASAGEPRPRNAARDYAIRSIYFVSIDGITRTLALDDDGTVQRPAAGVARIEQYIPHFLNNGTSYFLDTISRPFDDDACRGHFKGKSSPTLTGFVTAPYLDMFGGGLVETFCRAVASNGGLIGAVCVDVAHTERSVLESLTKIDALDVSIVQIPEPDGKPSADETDERKLPEPKTMTCETMPDTCPGELERSGIALVELKNFAALYYRNRLMAGARQVRRGGVFGGGCGKADSSECLFGVTVYSGTNGARPYWDVAVIRLRRPQPRDYIALIVCGLGLGIGIAALTLGYRKKTRAREAYFVRGFALGAVHVAASDQVIGGNDRAEAIVGRDLPRMTIHDSGEEVDPSTFSSFIDRARCVLIDEDGRIGLDGIVSYDVVRWQCEDKLTLSFYAYLHLRGWVRVTARVIVQPHQRDDLLLVIDTHVCEEHHELLNAIRLSPVPKASALQQRVALLQRVLAPAIDGIPLSDKVTILYFCDELDLARFQRWSRPLKHARTEVQIVVVTDRPLTPSPETRVVSRAAVGELCVAKGLPTAVLVDPKRVVREVAIGEDEIDRFVEVRVREMLRRVR